MTSLMGPPTADGRFGDFGGRFLPESLIPACAELEAAFTDAWADPAFHAEYEGVLRDYGGSQFSAFKAALVDLAVERLGPIGAEPQTQGVPP